MTLAIDFQSTFGQPLVDVHTGRIGGENSGATLVRRLIRMFPDRVAMVADQRDRHLCGQHNGFRVESLRRLRASETVLLSMDPLTALGRFHEWSGGSWRVAPQILNFAWQDTADWTRRPEKMSVAAATAAFPTIANSKKTARELLYMVRTLCAPSVYGTVEMAAVPLGIDIETAPGPEQHRALAEVVPIVLYPAMLLHARKRPEMFLNIVERVASKVELKVAAGLHPSCIDHDLVLRFDKLGLTWRAENRNDWYEACRTATAFLATALEESYGLAYLEAMRAGVIGVLPAREWARQIVPDGYPLLYGTQDEAAAMLHSVVNDLGRWKERLAHVPGWIAKNHDIRQFETGLKDGLARLWPEMGWNA